MTPSRVRAVRFAKELRVDHKVEKRLLYKEIAVIVLIVALFFLRQTFLYDDEAHGVENPTLEDFGDAIAMTDQP